MAINERLAHLPLSEPDAIALAAWTDNELERLRNVRRWLSSTYTPEPHAVFAHQRPKPRFTMNDAVEHLLNRRRQADKKLIDMLRKITVAMQNGDPSAFKHPLRED